MNWMAWGLFALVGWTALGVVGVGISARMGDRGKARRHGLSLVVVWVVYGAILGGVSLFQPETVVPLGKDQCFGTMCFAVMGVEPVQPLVAGETGRIVRVKIRVTNRGQDSASDGAIGVFLRDVEGRGWEPLPGLSGNALSSRVAPGSAIWSEPVFRVAQDATGLELIFRHGRWGWRRLVIGEGESLGHRPAVVRLDP